MHRQHDDIRFEPLELLDGAEAHATTPRAAPHGGDRIAIDGPRIAEYRMVDASVGQEHHAVAGDAVGFNQIAQDAAHGRPGRGIPPDRYLHGHDPGHLEGPRRGATPGFGHGIGMYRRGVAEIVAEPEYMVLQAG